MMQLISKDINLHIELMEREVIAKKNPNGKRRIFLSNKLKLSSYEN